MAVDVDQTAEIHVIEPAGRTWRPSRTGWIVRRALLAALVAGLLVLTAVVPDFNASHISYAAIFAMVGLSMNLLLGHAGQISLGHQAFVGIGAFTTAFVVTTLKLDFAMALPAAALSGGLAALVLGGAALRVRGLYLALVTLAYGAVAERTIFLFRPFTGGGAGLAAPRPTWLESDNTYAYLCLAFLAVIAYLDWRFIQTKAGRAVQAVRDSERVAASMGINVMAYKLLAFVLSGMVAGLAGGLLGHLVKDVTATPFSFFLALEFVLMTVVGGLGSRLGVIFGSVFFALLDKYLVTALDWLATKPLIGGAFRWILDVAKEPALLVPAVGSLLLILTLIQFPGGIGQQIRPIVRWFQGDRFRLAAMHEGKPTFAGGADVRP
ncbi:MAG TPA: branched-chain amino acid ABC transporter permease [Actinomycetota bacterium]|nr:branched-chain amino acid ABC transporter permease [Actinomycetota bacterium]